MLSIMAILRPNLSETLPIKNCHTNPPHIALNIKNDTLLTSNPNDKPNTDAIAKNPLTAIPLTKLPAIAKGAMENIFGMEIGVFSGIDGSFIRKRLSGKDENIIRHAAIINNV